MNLRTLYAAFTLALIPLPVFADKKLDALKAKAEKGDASAQYDLGVLYYTGRRVSKDEVEALKWYRKAAEQGDFLAQYHLAGMYYRGEGTPRDYVEALQWYRKIPKRGFRVQALSIKASQLFLGEIYYFGEGVPKDYAKAAEFWLEAAKQEEGEAQILLGLLYHAGEGVPKDYAKALNWYLKAADNLDGIDNKEWKEWYCELVKLGDSDQSLSSVQYQLGKAYQSHRFGQTRAAQAIPWLLKAAERGHAPAQYQLGEIYLYKDNTDYTESLNWFRKAAKQGNKLAQVKLGDIYRGGVGVPKDNAEAFKWYRKAAEQGDAGAQDRVSFMYYFGEGTPKDDVLSYLWVNVFLAQDNNGLKDLGHNDFTRQEAIGTARKLRDLLEKEMTPAQIAKAQELSSTYAALIKEGKSLPSD